MEDPACAKRLVTILETCMQDTGKARRLLPDGTYERVKPKSKKAALRSQESFYRAACDAARQEDSRTPVFQPVLPAAPGG